MATGVKMEGHCLCGDIKITVEQMSPKVGACHCQMCRRWGGGPFMSARCGTNVTFYHKENMGVYQSSAWAERGFCKKCGTHLFYRLIQDKQYFMPVGLFNEESGDNKITFNHQVFIDEKPEYYAFKNETTTMTGKEVFAKYSGK